MNETLWEMIMVGTIFVLMVLAAVFVPDFLIIR